MSRSRPLWFRLYTASFTALQSGHLLIRSLLVGFWMGVLRHDRLHQLDESYYNQSRMYFDDAYNRRGLWSWETETVTRHFKPGGRVMVLGAGGGREVLALRRAGFEAIGFECNAQFAEYAADLLRREGFRADDDSALARVVPRDEAPSDGTLYDGAIIGWGAYMLVAGRKRRIALLRQIHAQLPAGAPLLVSFYSRDSDNLHFRISAGFGNFWRRLLRRERLEIGDNLTPNFVHYFNKSEITNELNEVGFKIALYHGMNQKQDQDDYGYAVAFVQTPAV